MKAATIAPLFHIINQYIYIGSSVRSDRYHCRQQAAESNSKVLNTKDRECPNTLHDKERKLALGLPKTKQSRIMQLVGESMAIVDEFI
jgi:hypothetical protein